MKEVIELKLTKKEYEQFLVYNSLGNYISHIVNGKITVTEGDLLKVLIYAAEDHGLKDCIMDFEGNIMISRRLMTKAQKLLQGYDDVLLEEIAKDLMQDLNNKASVPKNKKK